MNLFRIAQAQMPVYPDRVQCSDYIRRAAESAAHTGAALLTLPEMFCCPYSTDCFPVFAEEEGGPLWQTCSDIAAEYRIFLSAGTMPERTSSGHIYNTAYFFGKDGQQIAKHRKVHLFDINVRDGQQFRESDILSPGDKITVFQTDSVTFGLAVCYDIRFPELFRLMTLKGAEVILVPAAFNMTTGPRHWELLFRSRALDNQVFTIGTAPARDPDASYVSWSHSIIVGPWGNVISQLGTEESLKITDIDLDEIREVKEQIPVLTHRRTDVYELRGR